MFQSVLGHSSELSIAKHSSRPTALQLGVFISYHGQQLSNSPLRCSHEATPDDTVEPIRSAEPSIRLDLLVEDLLNMLPMFSMRDRYCRDSVDNVFNIYSYLFISIQGI